MNRNPITLATGALLVIIFFFMLFTFQVRETEVAIRTTFGKAGDGSSITNSGFKVRLPWPIQKVHKFDKRIQASEWTFEQTSTSDGEIVLVKVFVTWSIQDPGLFFNRFSGNLNQADDTLRGIVRSAKNAVIADYTFGNLVSTDSDQLKFEEIEEEMTAKVRKDTQGNGLNIQMVGIKRLGLPESVTTAVFERMKGERQARIKEIEAEGEREAKTLKAEADLKANEILSRAEADAIKILGEAEAEAAKHFEVFKQDPELANFLFNLKALEGSLKEKATLILDPNTPPFNLLTTQPENGDVPASKQ